MRVDKNLPISVPTMLEVDKLSWTLNGYSPKPSPPVRGQQVVEGRGQEREWGTRARPLCILMLCEQHAKQMQILCKLELFSL